MLPSLRHALMPVLLLSAACGRKAEPPAREFDAAVAMQRVEQQLAFGPRIPGTAGHRAMAEWLDSLAQAGSDTTATQRWTHVTADGDSVPMVNVIARFNPAATRRVVYMAHWDTRPRADGPTSSDHSVAVVGANDGASGVAVLLGVMDALRASPPPETLGVDLVFVDGEDFGEFGPPRVDVLVGSTWYAAHLPPPGKPEFVVVWDMVGQHGLRLGRESLGSIAAADVVDLVWDTAAEMGYGHIFVNESIGPITDDHVPLIDAGIRAIDVIGWPYLHWHTPDDTFDKISAESLEAVGNVAVAVLRVSSR